MANESIGTGIKLKFNTAQIITIVVLIITLVVTFVSKADNAAVQRNSTEIKLIQQQIDMQYETIIYKLERIQKRIDEKDQK